MKKCIYLFPNKVLILFLFFSYLIGCQEEVMNQTPKADISATPTSGIAPLNVSINLSGTDTDGTIAKYELDFEGDGIFDASVTTPSPISHIYSNAGSWILTLQVTDDKGLTAKSTLNITVIANQAPTVTASAEPTNGSEPLPVLFSGTAADPDGTVAKYEWDFEGDGVIDFSSVSTAATTFTYLNAGNYSAMLKVTDDKGVTSNSIVNITVIANQAPTVTALAEPTIGYGPLSVSFSGTADDADGTIAKYEWDFEGDGIIDFSSTSTTVTTFTYINAGNYSAILKVTDDKGKSTTVTKAIVVKEAAYPGFLNLKFFIGGFWQYKWVFDEKVNGSQEALESGFTRITLVDTVTVNFGILGNLKLFKTEYSGTGNTYPLIWYGRPYLAFKDGVIYMAQIQDYAQWSVAILFDSRNGDFYGSQGFIGFFSPDRTETLSQVSIVNPFNPTYSLNGVVVSEPFYKPMCETIAGENICSEESHDYQVKEYYLSGIGFGGFTRSGTSIFTGGGFTDIFQSNMNVWLVDTNINQ